MLARTGKNDEALTGYLQGLSQGGEHISLSDIPWYAWRETLAYWLPMLLALWIASIGLALLFHRQWAHNEQLPYPIATITNALLPVRSGRINPIFRNRLFLIGLSAIVFFSLNNFVAAQNPNWIPINYRFLLYPLVGVFPLEFQSASGLSDILNFNLFFMAIGIGYLLPSTVAFSLGIGPIAFGFVAWIHRPVLWLQYPLRWHSLPPQCTHMRDIFGHSGDASFYWTALLPASHPAGAIHPVCGIRRSCSGRRRSRFPGQFHGVLRLSHVCPIGLADCSPLWGLHHHDLYSHGADSG